MCAGHSLGGEYAASGDPSCAYRASFVPPSPTAPQNNRTPWHRRPIIVCGVLVLLGGLFLAVLLITDRHRLRYWLLLTGHYCQLLRTTIVFDDGTIMSITTARVDARTVRVEYEVLNYGPSLRPRRPWIVLEMTLQDKAGAVTDVRRLLAVCPPSFTKGYWGGVTGESTLAVGPTCDALVIEPVDGFGGPPCFIHLPPCCK